MDPDEKRLLKRALQFDGLNLQQFFVGLARLKIEEVRKRVGTTRLEMARGPYLEALEGRGDPNDTTP
jgi:hypothetical protein